MSIALNTVVGDRDLCAWQPVHGVTWVQTRSPKHARRLVQRSDGRLVAHSVAVGYLRTFEFHHTIGWAIRLIARYTAGSTPTNEGLNGESRPPANRGTPPAWGTADRKAPAVCGAFGPSDPQTGGSDPWRRKQASAAGSGDSSSLSPTMHENRQLAGEAGCLGPGPAAGKESSS